MARYAAGTDVPTDRTRVEIERTLQRYGADQFLYGWDEGRAVIGFRMADRQVRFDLPLPDLAEFTSTPTGRSRTKAAAQAAWEQACRQRWRALLLVIKAKLEAVEAGIATFEEEFLAHVMLPDGSTVGRFMAPQLARAYSTGAMPAMLPALGPGGDA